MKLYTARHVLIKCYHVISFVDTRKHYNPPSSSVPVSVFSNVGPFRPLQVKIRVSKTTTTTFYLTETSRRGFALSMDSVIFLLLVMVRFVISLISVRVTSVHRLRWSCVASELSWKDPCFPMTNLWRNKALWKDLPCIYRPHLKFLIVRICIICISRALTAEVFHWGWISSPINDLLVVLVIAVTEMVNIWGGLLADSQLFIMFWGFIFVELRL